MTGRGLPDGFFRSLRDALGDRVLDRTADLERYAADALGIGVPPDLVALPDSTADVAADRKSVV